MPAGLQVWDSSGNLIIDTTTFIGRLIGSIDASAMSGSANVVGLDQGIPFAVPVINTGTLNSTYQTVTIPRVTFSGNTVSWIRQSPATGTTPSVTLILGVY